MPMNVHAVRSRLLKGGIPSRPHSRPDRLIGLPHATGALASHLHCAPHGCAARTAPQRPSPAVSRDPAPPLASRMPPAPSVQAFEYYRRPFVAVQLTQQEIEVRAPPCLCGAPAASSCPAIAGAGAGRATGGARHPPAPRWAGSRRAAAPAACGLLPHVQSAAARCAPPLEAHPAARPACSTTQEDMALIISQTKRRPRAIKEKSPSGYHSG